MVHRLSHSSTLHKVCEVQAEGCRTKSFPQPVLDKFYTGLAL